MDFSLDTDQLALRDAVRRFCDREYPAAERGGPESAEVAHRRREAMAGLGLFGLTFDERVGGSAMGSVESMLVAEEFGRALVAGPWLSSTIISGQLLAEVGDAALCERWLSPLVRGEGSIALAVQERGNRYALDQIETRARRSPGGWTIDGGKTLVLGGDDASLLLVLAQTDDDRNDNGHESGNGYGNHGPSLFAIDADAAGLRRVGFDTLDGRRAATIRFDAVRVDGDRLLGAEGCALAPVTQAIERGEAMLCAEATGAIDALLRLTVEHLRTRRQFGAPLAKFQTLQHRIADMAIALEQVRSMACGAALALQSGQSTERQRLLSAAKALTAQLGRRVAFDAIQLHGAMGMTDECVASRYAKRLIGIGQWFGDADFHLRRFASLRSTTT